MHDMNMFRPIEVESLTYDKKKKALTSLMFLKEKRDSMVKTRMCADGQNQKDGTWSKQETTSLTVATESVFITAIIDTHKGRNVACFNIPGAFLHADVNKNITMVFKGRLVELTVQVTPNLYRKYISQQEGDGHTLCQDAESSVWASEECLALLHEACG